MTPGLAVMLVVLVGYAFTSGGFSAGFDFLFSFDASKITVKRCWRPWVMPLHPEPGLWGDSHLRPYLPDGQSVARTTFVVAICDTCVALLAGLAIFPIIFANGMSPSAGPGADLYEPAAGLPADAVWHRLWCAVLRHGVGFAALTSAIP